MVIQLILYEIQFSFKKDGFLILRNFFNKNKIQLIKKIDALNKELNLNKNKNIVIENKISNTFKTPILY